MNPTMGSDGPRPSIHHVDCEVTDYARSRAFYLAALAPLGLRLVLELEREGGRRLAGFGVPPDPVFWIRAAGGAANRVHVAFRADSRAAVDAFHAAGLAAGGKDNGAPGLRPRYDDHYYAAYVLDPDGHNIEAVCRREA
jgi:catechol 2,3-dioxygenase-like lactoylglutathione lyase family enzyme